jgi:hypothetical protein
LWLKKEKHGARCQRLRPLILDSQEAEIRRIAVRSQSRQIVHQTLSQKILHKDSAGGVAQSKALSLSSSIAKKKKKGITER